MHEGSAIYHYLFNNEAPKTKQPGCWYVRIKPYNKHLGHVLRSLSMPAIRRRFKAEDGWSVLQDPSKEELLRYFRRRQDTNKESSPAAFDICTFEEAMVLQERAKREALKRRRAPSDVLNANVLKSAQLPTTRKSRQELATENAAAIKLAQTSELAEREDRRIQAQVEATAQQKAELEMEKARLEEALRKKESQEAFDADELDAAAE